MIGRWLSLLAAGLLAGCANLSLDLAPPRDALQEFELAGRFALRATPFGQPEQSAAGRLDWSHQAHADRVLLSSPLGHALAEIDIGPGRSRLQTSDGKVYESDDPDSLIASVVGQRLPVTRLPDWLLGRGSDAARLERDAQERPLRLREDGWLIAYAYDDERPEAPPARLTLTREGEIELKIRIETWKTRP